MSPPDDLLLKLSERWLGRRLRLEPMERCHEWSYPRFVKPLTPKALTARVYESADDLLQECRGLEGSAPLMVSDIVSIVAEARTFVLEGKLQDCALYEGSGDLEEAREFVSQLARAESLPRTLVLDVGLIESHGWALIEANAAWGAGLNGCDPAAVLPAIVAASAP